MREMIAADLCGECALDGFTVEPECCGRPTIIWSGDVHGWPYPAGEECCGSPDPVQVPCMTCDIAAQARALTALESALEAGND